MQEMQSSNFEATAERIGAYLDRIGFEGPLDRSVKCLADLQSAHLHKVPYENLDILRGTPLSLELDQLYEKIVIRRRGGYCFELNALFGWLLRGIGYTVTDYFARFWRDEPNPPPKRRHHVLRVEIGDTSYLSDVGVGGIVPRQPVAMVEGLEQVQGNELYRLQLDSSYGWVLEERKGEGWSSIYSFTEEPQLPKDYVMASYWCEHAPDSIFKKAAMIAIRTEGGRNTVAGEEFRIFTKEGVRAFRPDSEAAYREALRKYFGIEV